MSNLTLDTCWGSCRAFRTMLRSWRSTDERQPEVSQGTVVLAARAALADRCGTIRSPKLLIDRMEQYAESLEETGGRGFYKLAN